MRFGILGPLQVEGADGAEVPVAGAKRRALLARLLVDAGHAVAADRLIEDLWDGEPPPSASGTLQSHISHLRRALGAARLRTIGSGYALDVADGELDAATFEAELAEGRRLAAAGDADGAAGVLADAVGRWRGPALAEFAQTAWARPEAVRLEEARASATELLLESRLVIGRHDEVVGLAEAAVANHPLRERLWAQLMVALYRCGRQADALRAFQRLRTTLAEQLGIDPTAELVDLERRILRQDRQLLAEPRTSAPAPVVPTSASTPTSLPSGVVTFVLTDIVGSTSLWEAAPKHMEQALGRHDAILRGAIEAHGGVLLKARGEGDSTFSVFGRATDAIAAARAAHASLAAEPWPDETPLSVRMSIHTGEAVERDGDYYGRTVNRAARLRGLASGGHVLVSQATAQLVVDHLPADVRLEELGPEQLRDLDRPEVVYRLAVELPSRSASPAAGGPAPIPLPPRLTGRRPYGFVGRSRERAVLTDLLGRTSRGSLGVALVSGEPGIGKTALAAELARDAHEGGCAVIAGRSDDGVALAYQPWIEALGHLVANVPQHVLDDLGARRLLALARLLPEVSDRRGDLQLSSTDGDQEADRHVLFGAVSALLGAASAVTPVVVLLDDLHVADAPTLQLLRHFISTAAGRILVVVTYRDSDVEPDGSFADLLAALRRVDGVERLRLEGLSADDVVDLVAGLAGSSQQEVDRSLVDAVHRETDGNPFFTGELLRHLAESGAVERDDEGRWRVTAPMLGLPESVREVVSRRAERLGGQVRTALAAAALIGREFDLEVLAEALNADHDDLLGALEVAEAAGLIRSSAPGTFTFAHALVRHALEVDLTPTRRARLHRSIALALEAVGDASAKVTELAQHWAATGRVDDLDTAVDYAERAGTAAMRVLAPDEAVRWYRRALELLGEAVDGDDRRRCELLIRLGRARRVAGDRQFQATLVEAAHLARRIDDADLLARSVLAASQGAGWNQGRFDAELVELLEVCLETIDAADSARRARLLAALAAEIAPVAPLARRRALSDEAVAMARRLGDRITLFQVLASRPPAIWVPETLDDRIATSEELDALAADLAPPSDDVVSSTVLVARYAAAIWRSEVAGEMGDLATVDRCLEVMRAASEELGQPFLRWNWTRQQCNREVVAGHMEAARELFAEHLRIGRPAALSASAHIEFSICRHEGRTPDALEVILRELPSQLHVREPRILAAACHLEAGRRDEARHLVADLFTDITAITDSAIPYLGAAATLAELAVGLDDRDAASSLARVLDPFADRLAVGSGLAVHTTVAHALGLLAEFFGDDDDADRHFARSIDLCERVGLPFHLARSCLARGRVLLRRRAPDDVQLGLDLVRRAFDIAGEHGCAGVAHDAAEVLASVAARPDPPPLPPRVAGS